MDNLCHSLVGAAVARAGLKRKTALATATAVIASNLPDLDVLVFATSIPPVSFRRGITHGVPAQLLLPIVCAAGMWLLARRRSRGESPPAHFGWLLAISYIGVLIHVAMDLLNTYGVRLLSPMSQQWFYGDAVFIIDPWLWVMLAAGVGFARRGASVRPARIAVLAAALYVGGMVLSARAARAIVRDAWIARTGTPPRALMVGPQPASLLRKSVIVDAGDYYVEGSFAWFPRRVRFEEARTPRNENAPGVPEARADRDVAGLLIWSRFPVFESRPVADGIEVTVRDMRFKSGPGRGAFTARTVVKRSGF